VRWGGVGGLHAVPLHWRWDNTSCSMLPAVDLLTTAHRCVIHSYERTCTHCMVLTSAWAAPRPPPLALLLLRLALARAAPCHSLHMQLGLPWRHAPTMRCTPALLPAGCRCVCADAAASAAMHRVHRHVSHRLELLLPAVARLRDADCSTASADVASYAPAVAPAPGARAARRPTLLCMALHCTGRAPAAAHSFNCTSHHWGLCSLPTW
jgi:hypothetical protein